MCKPVKEYLNVAREYTREIFTYGGIAMFVWLWQTTSAMIAENSANNAHTAEILRTIDNRLQHLESCHEQEAQRAAQRDNAPQK